MFWFKLLNCEDSLPFSVLYHFELNVIGFVDKICSFKMSPLPLSGLKAIL